MRLTAIRAMNYTALRAAVVDIPAAARLVLIAGPNGSGKTALLDGIRLALTGAMPRGIVYKKDLPDLITDGEGKGFVGVTINRDGHQDEYMVNLKTGAASKDPPLSAAQGYTLFPQAFLALDATARRKVLFERAGVSLKPADVVAALVKKGYADAQVERVATALAAGLDSGVKRAREIVSEARGGWQAVTGETYGDVKGKDWKSVPDLDESPTTVTAKDVAAQRGQVEKLIALRDELESNERAHANSDSLHRDAGGVRQLEAELVALDEKIEAQRHQEVKLQKVATGSAGWTSPCPACGEVLLCPSAGRLEKHEPSDMPPPMAAAKAEAVRSGLSALRDERAKLVKRIDHGRASKLMLGRLPDRPKHDELVQAREDSRVALEELRLAEADLNRTADNQRKIVDAGARTDRAASYYRDVQDFTAIAHAINALPAEYLSAAITSINETLVETSKPMNALIQIGEDMELRYGPIRYGLASESQKWRAALALGLAFAKRAGGIVQMDAFDVIQPSHRGGILQMIAQQDYAQVIVGATLKTAPEFPTDAVFVHWLEKK